MDDAEFDCTQLPDDEMADYLAKRKGQQEKDRKDRAELEKRIRNFHWGGGMG